MSKSNSTKLVIDNIDDFITYLEENSENIRDAVESYKSRKTLPEGIVIVLNYTSKTHAIFGNTKDIKNKLMALNEEKKLVSYNANLSFGPGWVIMDMKRLSEVTDMFDENNIGYTQVDKDNYEMGKAAPKAENVPKKAKAQTEKVAAKSKKAQDETDYSTFTLVQLKSLLTDKGLPTTGKKDELVERLKNSENGEENNEEEEKPALKKSVKKVASSKQTSTKTAAKKTAKAKDDSIKNRDPPKSKNTGAQTLKATMNDFGNYEEKDTGIVFYELPVGTNGTKQKVAIGIQNTESEESGIDSLNPLTEEMIEECDNKKWRYLTDDIVKSMKKKDEDVYERLVALQARKEEVE